MNVILFCFFPFSGKHNGYIDKKKHECSYCSRKFAFKNDLIAHIRKHTGEKRMNIFYPLCLV